MVSSTYTPTRSMIQEPHSQHTATSLYSVSIPQSTRWRWLPSNGHESLAISTSAALLQRSRVELVDKLFLERVSSIQFSNSLHIITFPVPIIIDVTRSVPMPEYLPKDQERIRFVDRLYTAFASDPIEDGITHPTESIISDALRLDDNNTVLGWLRDSCLDTATPGFSASIFRCLGRIDNFGTNLWRNNLVRDGLARDAIEIRDAAVQTAELWGGLGLQMILESHSEPQMWLREYIRDVIDDLRV